MKGIRASDASTRGVVPMFARALVLWMLFIATGTSLAQNSAQSPPAERSAVTLQLKWRHQYQFAGFYAALHKGFYAKEGLDVRLVEGGPQINPTDPLISGQAQYAVSSPAIAIERQAGRPLVALAAIFQHSPTIALALRDSGIATPSDLAGRRLMLTRAADPEVVAMLIAEGISLSRVTVLPHSGRVADLAEHRTDAQSAYITDQPYELARLGLTPSIIDPRQYGIDFYGDCLVTTESEVRSHPERVAAFLRATRRGWEYAMNHREEIADVILAHYRPARTRDQLLYEARTMEELILPRLVEIGHMSAGRWEHIAETYARIGLMKPGFSLDGFLLRDYQLESDTRVRQALETASTALAVILGLALVLGLYSWQLRRAVRQRTRSLNESEQRLREQNELYEALFRAQSDAKVGLLIIEEGRIILCNKAIADISGYTEAELKALPSFALMVHPEDREMVVANHRRRLAGEEFENIYDIAIVRKSGERGEVEIAVSGMPGPKGMRVLVVVVDVSARKHAERALRESEARVRQLNEGLEQQVAARTGELTAAIGDMESFSYSVSHDLRTPLRAIEGFSSLLETDYGDRLDAAGRDYLGRIRRAAQRMAELIDDLLDLSRLTRLPVKRSAIDLSAMAQSIVAELHDREPGRDVHVSVEPGLTASADPGLMRVALTNLLANAWKFTQPNGPARVEFGRAWHHGADAYYVRDNGVGFDMSFADKLFKPFHRLHDAGDFEGTGIGLATVRRIIERHGGTVSAEGAPGLGATFYFTLGEAADTPGRLRVMGRP